jgi:hypothetical protein
MKPFIRAVNIVFCVVLFWGIPVLAFEQKPVAGVGKKSSEGPIGSIVLKAPVNSPLFSGCLRAFEENPVAGSEEKSPEASAEFIILRVPVASPAFSSCPLALVNDEPVTLAEFNRSLAAIHEGVSDEKKQAPHITYGQILRRLINTRLALEEAGAMGIDELPEIESNMEVFSRQTLRELAVEEQTKDVTADEAEVEKSYRDMVKEVKITAVLFKTKEEAEKTEASLKAGKDFGVLVKQAAAEGSGKVFSEGKYLRESMFEPWMKNALADMKVDSVSPVIRMPRGFAMVRLEDIQYPEDPKAREEARHQVLAAKRFKALIDYNEALSKKYLEMDQKLFDSLDFEAETPGLLNLLEDKRILVEVKGDEPVTVAEFANAVKETFFHDVEGAIKRKKVNKRKIEILELLLTKKVLVLDARQRGLDKTEQYKEAVKDFRNALIFSAFVKRVVAPDVKVSSDEMKAYYDGHISQYSTPERIRMNTLVFAKRSDAEKAIEDLRKGTDVRWLKGNAEGQVDKKTEGLMLAFEGDIVPMTDLPEGAIKALSGCKAGDARLYEGPDKYFYVLAVQEVFPSQPIPFEEIKDKMAETIAAKRLNEKFEEWARKLWGAYNVKIYARDLAEELEKAGR